MIVDPYSDEIYTKRKTRLLKLLTERFPETSTLKHPSDGLGNSLERMPPFTQAEANSDQRYFYLIAKCKHSFRKKDAPHSLQFTLYIISGQVLHANCSCKAGNIATTFLP